MKIKKLVTAAALAMGLVSGSAMADKGGFVYADLGQVSYGYIFGSAIAERVGGGANFVDFLNGTLSVGAEGALANFGTSNGFALLGQESVRAWAVMAGGRVTWKIPHVEGLGIFGRLGIIRATSTFQDFQGFRHKSTNNDIYKAIGVQYAFNKMWSIHATYEDLGSVVGSGIPAVGTFGMTMNAVGVDLNF